MHGHGEKPFLCTFEGCERGVPGNGFPRHWNLCDHMKRAHNRSPSPQVTCKASRGQIKRKNSSSETSSSQKFPTTASATIDKARAPGRRLRLSEKWQHCCQKLLSELPEDLSDPEVIAQKLQNAAQVLSELQGIVSALKQMKSGPKMERIISRQSG
jgi:hypothetical protein